MEGGTNHTSNVQELNTEMTSRWFKSFVEDDLDSQLREELNACVFVTKATRYHIRFRTPWYSSHIFKSAVIIKIGTFIAINTRCNQLESPAGVG